MASPDIITHDGEGAPSAVSDRVLFSDAGSAQTQGINSSSILYVSLFLILIAFFALANAQRSFDQSGNYETVTADGEMRRGGLNIAPNGGRSVVVEEDGDQRAAKLSAELAALFRSTFQDAEYSHRVETGAVVIDVPRRDLLGRMDKDIPLSRQLFLKRMSSLFVSQSRALRMSITLPESDQGANPIRDAALLSGYVSYYSSDTAMVSVHFEPISSDIIRFRFDLSDHASDARGL